MAKNLSTIARKRVGATKQERSDKMREVALKKHAKMSKKAKRAHSLKMLNARYKK